jgi:hypothetical protein
MEEPYVTLVDVLAVQALLGSIVYVGGSVVLAVLIRRWTAAKWATIFLFVCLFVPLAVGLSIVCWSYEPFLGRGDGMVFEFLNVPALVAITILVPLMLFVARVISGTPQKKESS